MNGDDRTVMHRDASFWNSPGCATKYHLPRDGETGPYGHPVALCNKRIQLDESNCCMESTAGPLMCKRCEQIGTSETEGNDNE